MSEHQKDLLSLMVLPLLLLIMGCLMGGLIFRSKIFTWLGLFKFQLAWGMALGAFIGIIGGVYELQIAKYAQHYHESKESVERRRGGGLGLGLLVMLCLSFYFLRYFIANMSVAILTEAAYYFILGGVAFSIALGITFICASVGRSKVQ